MAKQMSLVLVKDVIVGEETGFIFKQKKPDKIVYRVVRANNFRARKFYFPYELDYLSDIGVNITIK